ncbi:MAG: dienelactone hydrolase family protein [Desulfuromonadales bacterium]|nr:dienelactone hydrolase family protein [Desulfuromonadales bacterium]MBN2791907.1 dienelactone hydrolase family protein [Desulfuromonadales bacterium]
MTFFKYAPLLIFLFFILSACGGQSLRIKSYAPVPELGVKISGTIVKPDGEGPFPAVVFLHSCAGRASNDYEWANRLKNWGYVTYLLDSFGGRGVSNVCSSGKVTTLERALDAHAAKVQLGALSFVDRDRIGVMGYSHGGRTVLDAVSYNLVEYSLPEEARDPFKAAISLYPYCHTSIDTNTHTMILIGDKDDWTPSSACEMNRPAAHDQGQEIVVKVYPGAYHKFDDMSKISPKITSSGHYLAYNRSAMQDAVPRVKAFFDKHLR